MESPGGLLFLANYQVGDHLAAIHDPRIAGGLLTYFWSDLEPASGIYQWPLIDRRIAAWAAADKKVALRIVWSADGNWPPPAAKSPTPGWLIQRGAKMVRDSVSLTEIPLCFDPLYVEFATRLVAKVAEEYDGNPHVAFIDMTPGAETRPLRYKLTEKNPSLLSTFMARADSAGRTYSPDLWLGVMRAMIDQARRCFLRTPVLVTLHQDFFSAIGDYATGAGCYTGQNGLKGGDYADPMKIWFKAFRAWREYTKLYFEMLGPASQANGSLMEHVLAAERVGATWLGVYPQDALRGIPGQPNFDPANSDALDYGATRLGR